MGVLIGDEPMANLPSFVVASCDEIFDRAKNKFYEKRFNVLSRVPANVFEPHPAGATKIDDGSFFWTLFFTAALFGVAYYFWT